MDAPSRTEALDLGALGPITDAVESGYGLPEVVRAAARALDASLVLIDRSSSVLAGAPGRAAADGGSHGAGPSTGAGGTSTGSARVLSSSFRMPGSPVLTLPADGTPHVGPRPRIEGQAEPGVPYVLLVLDGTLLARVAPDAEGRFAYDVPSELASGSHELRAYAELLGVHSTGSASNRFVVVNESEVPSPPEPEPEPEPGLLPVELQVGCGCGSAPGMGLWVGTLLLLAAWLGRATARRRAGGTPRSG